MIGKETPLPWRALGPLLLARMCEPVAYTIIFPFINQFCEHLLPDVPKSKIGSYSGAIEGLFALSAACTLFIWGQLADKYGRKPVILRGLLGLAIGTSAFGAARTYWFALLARIFCGLLAGNGSAMRAVLGEITDPTNVARATALFSVCFEVSMVAAPAVSGLLSDPAHQYPNSFLARIQLLRDLPYLLPCAVVSALALLAFLVFFFSFEETLHSKRRTVDMPRSGERTPLLADAESAPAISPMHMTAEVEQRFSALRLVQVPAIRHCLVAFFLNTFLSLGFDSVFILFAYSDIELGGLALSSKTIAACLSFRGLFSIFWAMVCFAPIQKKFGSARMYHIYVGCWLLAYSLPPLMNYLRLHGGSFWQPHHEGTLSVAMSALMAVEMVIYALGDNQFPLIMMAINDAAPSTQELGRVNGLGLSVSSVARACGPFIANGLYSLSAQYSFSPGVWLAMLLCAGLGFVQTFWCFQEEKIKKDPDYS